MPRLPFIATTALALCVATSSAFARGGDERAVRGEWLAAPEVRALVSSEVGGVITRAIVLIERGRPALVVETAGAAGLAGRRAVDRFQHGLGVHAIADHARAIDGLALRGAELSFDLALEGQRDPLRCALDLRGDAVPRCEGRFTRPGENPPVVVPVPPPYPRPPRWAARPEVITACGAAFYGAANEAACLDQVHTFAFDPVPVIAACDTHAYGDAAALECLAVASSFVLPPQRTIVACDTATYGQESFIHCLRQAAPFRFDAIPTIEACDRAMYGDQSTIACVGAASRYPFDAAPTIAACDQSTYGDEAAIACIRRGGAY